MFPQLTRDFMPVPTMPEVDVSELRAMVRRANELEERIRQLQGTIESQARAFTAAMGRERSLQSGPLTASPEVALKSR